MKRIVMIMLIGVLALSGVAGAGFLDKAKEYKDQLKGLKDKDKPAGDAGQGGPAHDEKTVADGLKEALTIGSGKAVELVSKQDGYFGNPRIKVPLPEKVQKAEKTLRKVGAGKQVDEFVLTMNRAAEKAAPVAKDIFVGAIREMSITDAIKILRGNDTAATDYFKAKTRDKLYGAFKPTVSRAVMEVGVTKAYQRLVDKAKKTRLIKDESMDLDHHVTTKALDGLFYMVGEEEKKIRKDPVARVTDLLKKVFGK